MNAKNSAWMLGKARRMSCAVFAALAAVVGGFAATPGADAQVVTQADYGTSSPVVNGVLGTDEYGPGNSFVYSGGGTGFGGVLGGATAKLYMKSDANNLYILFQPGATMNDYAVLYMKTACGGQNDSTMADCQDNGRCVISNLGAAGNDGFPFDVSYALSMSQFGCTLFQLNAGGNGSLGVISITSAGCSGANTAIREVSIPLASIGAAGGKRNIDFFMAYCSDTLFNSNETIPPMAAINGAANPGNTATVNYTLFDRFVTTSPIMISQIYGGGGNSGATYNADYVELYNSSTGAVDLSDYSINYASSTGAPSTRQGLNGVIAAKSYFLIRTTTPSTTNVGNPLPRPDLTFASPDMSASTGKLGLLFNSPTIATGNGFVPPTGGSLVDFVGWGTADFREAGGAPGSPAGTTANNACATTVGSATLAIVRGGCGATDTNVNSADFGTAAIAPRPRSSLNSVNNGVAGISSFFSAAAGATPTVTIQAQTCANANASGAATATINLTSIGGGASVAMTNNGSGLFTLSTFTVPAATIPEIYYLPVSIADGTSTGGGVITLNVTSASAPGNDVWNTNVASFTVPGTGARVEGTLVNSTLDSAANCGTGSGDVYYYFTPATTGSYAVAMCASGFNADTLVSIHVGGAIPNSTVGAAAGNQVASGCNDTGATALGCNSHGAFTATLTGGQLYTIRCGKFTTGTNFAFALTVLPAAPANDSCGTATNVTITSGFGSAAGSNLFAKAGLDPTVSFSPTCATAAKDVYYTFTTNATASNWIISTCGDATQDTVLELFQNCTDTCSLACNDDSAGCGNGTQSSINVALAATTTYIVRVSSKGASPAGGTLALQIVQAVAPGNDSCATSSSIASTGGTVSGSLQFATLDGPSTACGASVDRDMWFSFAPTTFGNWRFSTCGSASNTVLELWSACGGTVLNCNDDFGGACGTASQFDAFNLPAGTYLVRVANKSGSTAGAFTLTVSSAAPSNDTCAGAQTLPLNTPVAGTTVTASSDYNFSGASALFLGLGQTAIAAPGRDAVYTFTAPISGPYSFRVFGYSTSQNVVLYATNTCPAPGTIADANVLAASNRNSAFGSEELMCLSLSGGQQIYLIVDDAGSANTGSTFIVEALTCSRETEPNDTTATANTYSFGANGMEGTASTTTDPDFYSLGTPASGSRIFAMIDGNSANTNDFQLRVTDTANTLEFDDDDGDPAFGTNSPVIAGAIANGNPLFLRVNPFSTISEPYHLYSVVQSGTATTETEPNNTTATANSGSGYWSGSISSTDSADIFAFTANVGQEIFFALDCLPGKTGTAFDGVLAILDSAGNVLVSVNGSATTVAATPNPGSGLTATTPAFPGEGLVWHAFATGTYYARVTTSTTTSSPYLLSISAGPNPINGACCVGTVCSVSNNLTCQSQFGTFQGSGTTCSPDPCVIGACCRVDNTCATMLAAACTSAGGLYQGDNTTCPPSPACPATGSCCVGTNCAVTFQVNCGGIWNSGGICAPNPCVGACCSAAGVCTLTTTSGCTGSGVTFAGLGTTCTSNPCVTGSCCFGDGSCSILTSAGCTAQSGSGWVSGGSCGSLAYAAPSTSPNTLENITATGTALTFSSLDDGDAAITLPFTFQFYDQTKAAGSSLRAGVNGFITFGAAATAFSNDTPPTTAAPNDAVYALWDDLYLRNATSRVIYETRGTAPYRRLIVQWDRVQLRADVTPYPENTFQIILFETSNAIELRYGTMQTATASWTATVGIENAAGTAANLIAQAGVVTGNTARLYVPSGLICSPPSGSCCSGVGGTTCTVGTFAACQTVFGNFNGNGSSCSPNPCAPGACCTTDGNCSIQFATACSSLGGIYQGDNTICGQIPCPPTGACCAGATCSIKFQSQCSNPSVWYTGQTCSPNYCVGACCDGTNACTLQLATDCISPSNFQGQGTTCTPTNYCLARCCFSDGTCQTLAASACTTAGGTPGANGTTCGTITYNAGGPPPTAVCSEPFEDISASPTATTFTLDTGTADVGADTNNSIPFAFYYFGELQSVFNISTNGYITFGATTATADTSPANYVVAPWNRDLQLQPTTLAVGSQSTQVKYEVRGTAPMRRLIVQWTGVNNFNSTTTPHTFEVILFESSNCISFRYQTLSAASATFVGIKPPTGATTVAITPAANTDLQNSCRLLCPAGMICPQPTGACCTGIVCTTVDYGACQSGGGTFQGYATSCTPNPCTPPGACCTAAGSCSFITAGACAAASGYFQGEGVACSPTPCPVGACCLASGACVIDINQDCLAQFGFRWTLAGSCSPNLCVGRCCAGDGTCTITTQALCTGRYGGDGSNCIGPVGSPQDFPSSDPALPLLVPDNTTVTSTVNIGPSFTVGKATLTLTIPDHTFVGDLTVSLSHGATTVVLWGRACSGSDNLTATFDDAGTNYTVCANGPQGTIQPKTGSVTAGLLSSFIGADSSGVWTLTIQDSASGDTGSLVSWSVTLSPALSPCQGACCVAGTCQVLNSDACALLAGSSYKGDGTACAAYPAPASPTDVAVSSAAYCTIGGPASITLSANCSGGTLNWYAGSCGGAFVGTGSSVTIAAPSVSTTYYARCETDCGYSACESVAVSVTAGPLASAGADQSICAGSTAALSGSASNFTTTVWSSSGDGSFADASSLSTVYTPGSGDVAFGSAILTLTAGGNAPCAPAISSLTLTIQGQPTAVAGVPLTVGGCGAFPLPLNGVVTNASSTLWTTDGSGTFGDASNPVTTYTLSSGDLAASVIHLTLTANATSPCTGSVSSVLTVNVIPPPHTAYVDDNYVGLPNGTSVDWPYTGAAGSHTIGCDAFATIQAGLNAVVASTVNVAPGTYDEDISITLANTNLVGSGAAVTTIRGVFNGSGNTISVGASNVTISGLTITRLGNNVADWNNANGVLNSAGIAIIGTALTGMTVRDCIISGNRTGIDINNSNGHTVRNCVIDNNRTGLIFRNQTDNITLTQNKITNNWTVGVLFLDASGGTNSPVQTAANCSFTNNDISGNWYGQIVDRQSGGSLPAPGTTNLKNFSGNWLGTTSPVISTANSAEPGYAAQIPVMFGGSAVAPGGQPDVCGPASANFDITPMLSSGTDTDVSTGFGSNGFQGSYDALTVTAQIAQTGSTGRIQEAHDAVNTGGTVTVQAGSYSENVSITKRLTIDGAGSGTCASGSDPLTQTVVTPASASVPVFTISDVGGSSPVDRLVLRDLRITGGGSGMAGVYMLAATGQTRSHYTFDNVALASNGGPGLEFQSNGGGFGDVEVLDSSICSNYQGIVTHTSLATFDGLTVNGCEVRNNVFNGVAMYGSTTSGFTPTNVSILNTQLSANGQSNNLFQGSGDLSFFEFNGNALIQNVSINTTGRVPLQLRGKGTTNTATWQPSGLVSINGLTVTGAADRPAMYIHFYNDVTGISFNNVDVSGFSSLNPPNTGFSVSGLILDQTGAAPLQLGNTIFPCTPGYASVAVYNTGGAHASCNTVFGAAVTVAQKEFCVFDGDDVFGFGQVTFDDIAIAAQPIGGSVCEGQPFLMNVAVSGTGPFSYQWYRDATPVGTNANFYFIPAASGVDTGNYHVDVTNVCGTVSSATVSFTAVPFPVTPTSAFSSPANACPGGAGTISLSATGGIGTTLQWFTGSCGGTPVGSGNPLVISSPLVDTTYYARWVTTCGISGCASVTVTVGDNSDPTIAGCPADIDVNNTPGQCGAAVSWTPPTANDNCPGVMLTSNYNPGHVFPVGPTTVTYTATDASNRTATCSFTVTVHDTEAPVIHDCPSNITVTATGGACTANASWTAPTITDNCPGATINGSHSPGAFPVGVTTVTYTGQDVNGNPAAPCNFTVTVLPDPSNLVAFVDDSYVGLPDGTAVNFPFDGLPGPYSIGCNAFATIQGGINAVAAGGSVNVAAGSYAELIRIDHQVWLFGPNQGVCFGDARGAEAVIRPPAGAAALTDILVYIAASGVKIDGFTIDGDNLVAGGEAVGAEFADVGNLISNGSFEDDVTYPFVHVGNLTVSNNILRNPNDVGVQIYNDGSGPVSNANYIACNGMQNMQGLNVIGTGGPYDRIDVLLYNDTYALIAGNTFAGVNIGVQTGNNYRASDGNPAAVSGNTFTGVETVGIWHNLHYANADAWSIDTNSITGLNNANSAGIFVTSLYSAATATVTDNTVSAFASGMEFWNNPATPAVSVSGGSVSGCNDGIFFYNSWNPGYGDGDTSRLAIADIDLVGNTSTGLRVLDTPGDDPGGPVRGDLTVEASGLTASGSTTGVSISGARAHLYMHDSLASVTGNAVGVAVSGGSARIQTTNLSGNSSAGVEVSGGALVDLGQCAPGVDFTGLGVSTGGNDLSGYGFDGASPFAIVNTNNSSEADVRAANNLFGATGADDINLALSGNGGANSNILYSQTGGPQFALQPLPITTCAGSNITFTALAYNIVGYQWNYNGGPILGQTGASLTINGVTTSDAGNYSVTITDLCGNQLTSNVVGLTVNVGPSIVTPPSGGSVCEGQPFTFTVVAGGTMPFSYQWRFNTSPISGANSASYTIPAVAMGDTGSYDVVVTNLCGNATSIAVSLTVNPLPVAPTSASSSSTGYCTGTVPATITLSAAGGSGDTLEWFSGSCGGTPVGTGSPLVIAAPGSTTTYYVRWVNGCGQSTCADVTVNVSTDPSTPAAGSDIISPCPGTPVTLTATAGPGETVDWYTGSCGGSFVGSGLSLTVNPMVNTTYYARARNTTTTCVSAGCDDLSVTVTTTTPAVTYVDDNYTGLPLGTAVNFPDNGLPGPHTIGCDAFATIQLGVNAVANLGTVNVAAGSYNEDVGIGKSISVLGAGAGLSVVSGPIGGPGSTFALSASNITLAGFTITRDGNNTTDWNNPGTNTAGVSMSNSAFTGSTVRDNLITQTRTGIDINNTSGHTVRNNVITDNRTGLVLRNATNNLTVAENTITNNWTVGIVFLDASGGSNVPPQTASNCSFYNNNLSGNWYGQIVDRQTGGSLPAPGANPKDFSGNWLGTTSPVITNANSTEPGYAVQIPVAFGGSAVPPGGQPDIAGTASANFDITPYLNSGTDTDAGAYADTYGFQGDFSALTVTSSLAQTGSTGRVQEGHDRVNLGGTVNVTVGTFSENVAISKPVTIDGAGSGTCASGSDPLTQTVIAAASPVSPVVSISNVGGASAMSPLTIREVRITGGGSGMAGVQVSAPSGQTRSHYLFDDVAIASNGGSGIEFVGSGDSFTDVQVLNSSLCSNYQGIRTATSLAGFDGLTVDGCEVRSNVFNGMAMHGSTASGFNPTNITVSNTQFSSNGQSNNFFQGSGDLSFFEFNGNANIQNVSVATTGRVPVQFRGRGMASPGTWLPSGTVSINGLTITGAADRPALYIQTYSGVSNITLNNVDLSGVTSSNPPNTAFSVAGLILDHTGATPLELGNTIFPCPGGGYASAAVYNVGGAHASCSTVFVGATTLAQKEGCVVDADDPFGLPGQITFDDVLIVGQPSGGSVCVGSPFVFSVSASGAAPITYQWRHDSMPIGGATSSSYSIASATLADAGSYDVQVTNACGTVTTTPVAFNVYPNPVAPTLASSDAPSYCTAVAPSSITLTATGGSGDTLEWFSGSCGGTPVGTGSPLTIAAPGTTTTYYARWTTANCGSSTCASTTVTVNVSPAAPASASASPTIVCDSSSVTLTASVGGGETVDWYTGSCGGTLVGSGSPLVTTVGSTTTFYARTRSISSGCVSTTCATASVTVYPSPVAPTSASSSSTSFCAGTLSTITLTASGGSGDTLKWYTGSCGGTLIGIGSPFNIVAPSVSTTYYARWETANCGDSACASVAVSVQAQPTVNAGGPYTICEGGVALLTGAATGASSVGWTTSGSGFFVDPSQPVTAYHPSPADIAAGSVLLTLTANAMSPCVGSVSSSVTLTILPKPVAPTSASVDHNNFCTGTVSTITLSATGGSGTKLAWHAGACDNPIIGSGASLAIPAPTSTTTYYANWVNSCGASTCVAVTVTVLPNPVAPTGASASQTSWCAGSGPSNITLTASGGSGDTVQWFSGSCGGTSVGSGNPLVIPAPSSTTTYYARWHNTCGDSACAAVNVTVNPLPVAPASASVDSPAYCQGAGPVNITLTATGGSGDSLKWYAGSCGGSLVGIGSPLVIAAPGSTTTYFARWETTACGNSSCQSVTVTVNPQAVAPTSVTSSANNYCSTSIASITLTAVGGSGDTLEWFDDSCGGNLIGTGTPLTIAAPLATTTYYARWTNGCGPSTCASLEVTVTPAVGACCSGWGTNKTCQIVPPSSCVGFGPANAYRGNCTTCGPTTCCPADYNNNGIVSVQDIFDYLAAYFDPSNTTTGDFNNNSLKSPQDIFDFLFHYFSGC